MLTRSVALPLLQIFASLAAGYGERTWKGYDGWDGYTYGISKRDHSVPAQPVHEDHKPLARRQGWVSPPYNFIYKFPLPIPPVKQPKQIITNTSTGRSVWYYEVEIKNYTQQVYPDLGPTRLVGYDGISPGPTFIIPRGQEAIVRFVNNAQLPISVHLHGSYSRAPFEGWAEDTTNPGQYKDYYYPNSQEGRTMWYHDHAMGITAENAYFGQAGAYILQDPAESALNLPSGYGEFDIPLIIASKQYLSDGSLFSPAGERNSLWGDVIHVNGQPWPFFDVQPRKYRLRFLDASVSRSFSLFFAKSTALKTKLDFQVIASDTGLLETPVTSNRLWMSLAERWEVVFDFSPFAGQSIELRNEEGVGGMGTDKNYTETTKVMKFNVARNLASPDGSVVPSKLRQVSFPPSRNVIDRSFTFNRTSKGEWLINGVGFADVPNRVLARPERGGVEVWELINTSPGWTHPIHVHLVDFKILRREGWRGRGVQPYEAAGLKDVVWLARRERVLIEAHFEPWDGLYMFHCHNLLHEDHDMMAAFNVTSLPDFAFDKNSSNARFLDPMDPLWRARPYQVADLRAGTGPFRLLPSSSACSSWPASTPIRTLPPSTPRWHSTTLTAPPGPLRHRRCASIAASLFGFECGCEQGGITSCGREDTGGFLA
ncbi:hypothetical protein MAPG_02917 [Magnaporthiopsis poae ATCC 64411]|uniref:Bilirubin oxidase n=1 Tax=Magnaporthiopsis poae (strain ATCC 64411 / 73-15) TaxID=644358 RepID=A0A0C4DSN5_MAGP6|nr:hypothetical protein MAPG_02917 [Magnaporthiopsis poae ATCC 64411]